MAIDFLLWVWVCFDPFVGFHGFCSVSWSVSWSVSMVFVLILGRFDFDLCLCLDGIRWVAVSFQV